MMEVMDKVGVEAIMVVVTNSLLLFDDALAVMDFDGLVLSLCLSRLIPWRLSATQSILLFPVEFF